MTTDHEVTNETKEAEGREAQEAHVSGSAPTPEEEEAAERGRAATQSDNDEVARHYEEMTDIGSNVKGEGEVS